MREHVIALTAVRRAALARGDATNDVRSVLQHLRCVERAFATGDTLDENLAVFIDENAHVRTVSMADV